MIHVIAIITAQPGKRRELLEEFSAVLANVRAEKGCIEYQPVTDTEDAGSQAKLGPDAYMVVEKWDRMEDLRAHAASSYMVDYGERVGHLVAERAVYVLN